MRFISGINENSQANTPSGLPSGCVMWYDCKGGGLKLIDQSGFGNDAVINGGVWGADWLALDVRTGYCTHSATLPFYKRGKEGNSFTIGLVTQLNKPASGSDIQILGRHGYNSGLLCDRNAIYHCIWYEDDNSKKQVRVRAAGVMWTEFDTSKPIFLAITFNGFGKKYDLWLNGNKFISSAALPAGKYFLKGIASNPVMTGHNKPKYNIKQNVFHEFGFNRALTDAEILGLYQSLGEQINQPQPDVIVLQDNFEGAISSMWVKEFANNVYSGTISTKYAKEGSSSLRIELRKSDPNVNDSKRSEIARAEPEQALRDSTYRFSILLPDGGDEDYALDPEGSEIIAQWHNVPDKGEPWTTPPLALRTFNGRYIIERCWDDAAITSTEQMIKKGNRATHDLGPYVPDKGRWVNWIFHVRWGWLASQNPTIEVYKDEIKVLDLPGLPNTTNDKYGVKLKLGIYKWDWAHPELEYSCLTKRVIYFDAVRIE